MYMLDSSVTLAKSDPKSREDTPAPAQLHRYPGQSNIEAASNEASHFGICTSGGNRRGWPEKRVGAPVAYASWL